MDLAGKGLPSGGGIGYEIFDKGDAFSSTSFVQNINHLRALEGELSRTIRAIGRVAGARASTSSCPERRLFERDSEPPRASIVLKLRGELDPGAGPRRAPSRRLRGRGAEAGTRLDRRRARPAPRRRRAIGRHAAGSLALDEKQAAIERRLRSAGRADRRRNRRQRTRPRAGGGRIRRQPHREPLRNLRSGEPRRALDADPRRESRSRADPDGPVSVGNELPGAKPRAATRPAATPRTRTRRSSITRSRARPARR